VRWRRRRRSDAAVESRRSAASGVEFDAIAVTGTDHFADAHANFEPEQFKRRDG
jgi:hypothetical protein